MARTFPVLLVAIWCACSPLFGEDVRSSMSVQETVNWATEQSLKDDYALEPKSRPNPEAREALYVILADPEQKGSWRSVVYAFRFLGREDDVPRIVEWIEGFRGETLSPQESYAILQAQTALGVMNRRGVEGAREACDKMMSPDYWRKLGIAIGASESVTRRGGSDCYLATHSVVSNIYSRDPGFRNKVNKIAEKIADPDQRSVYARESASALKDYDAHMADGLLPSQRLGREQAEIRQRLVEEKKPELPSRRAYREAWQRGSLDKVALDVSTRRRLIREAREAFAAVAADLLKGDREAVVRRMAADGKPCVLAGVDPPGIAAEVLKERDADAFFETHAALLRANLLGDLDETSATIRLCVFDVAKKGTVDAHKAATSPETAVDLVYVQIPYPNARKVVQAYPLLASKGWNLTTSGPQHAPSLCMLWQAGHWYWVPLGH